MQSEKAVEQRGYHKKPEPFHFDNSAIFREHILTYNHSLIRGGYCMRHCTRCGTGVRLMTYTAYENRYGGGPCLCKRCEKILAEKKKPFKKEDKFVSGHGTGFRIYRDGMGKPTGIIGLIA